MEKTFISEFFYKQYPTFKDAIAVEEEHGNKITYKDLMLKARRIASFFVCAFEPNGLKSNGMYIAVQLDKSIEYVAAILACQLLGIAFIPLGKDLPKQRINEIINDVNLSMIYDETQAAFANRYRPIDITTTMFERHLDDPAYAIYSSGSTGKPKGIIVPEKGILNLVYNQTKAFNVKTGSKYLWVLSNNFDGALSDYFVAMFNGATLVTIDGPVAKVYSCLYSHIKDFGITHIDMPPSVLAYLSPEYLPECLETIIVGGEALDISTAVKFADRVNLVNVYGPTEATICTSLCKITKDWNAPLIGQPFDNVKYTIVNDELYIGGDQLALGYINNEELTKKKFVLVDVHLENGAIETIRYFKTGDKVKTDEDGNIVFIGRIDRQFKYHGQLIAPEEIEQCFKNECYKTAVKLIDGKIVCFVESEYEISTDLLDSIVKQTLPEWMIPNKYVFYKKFPYLKSGKIDIMSLTDTIADEEKEKVDNATVYSTPTERKIAFLIKDILKLNNNPDKYMSFRDLGGDSINAIVLMTRLQNDFGITMTPNEFCSNSSIYKIARYDTTQAGYEVSSLKLNKIAEDYEATIINRIDTTNDTRICLLTGATGYLGIRVLAKLLNDETIHRVICIIRAKDITHAKNRLLANAVNNNLFDVVNNNIDKIEFITGDISKPKFGLTDLLYENIAKLASIVFHCAAEVNVFKPYETLENNIVIGTRNIIQFCNDYNQKHLHYASTLSVFVSTTKDRGTVYETDQLIGNHELVYGGYGQTKYVAEKIVLLSSIPNTIYRYGLLTPDSKSLVSAKSDFLTMFIRGAKTVGYLPYDYTNTMAVDITPVDIAVDKTYMIMFSNQTGAFHITANSPVKLNELSSILKKKNVIIDMLRYSLWVSMADSPENNTDVNVQACRQALCKFENIRHGFMDLFQTTDIVFDDSRTNRIISKYDNPAFNRNVYLEHYIDALDNANH